MNTVSYEDLHREHVSWSSKIEYWKIELNILEKLCFQHSSNGRDPFEILQCRNSIRHLQRYLKGMQQQVNSHESFLRSLTVDEGSPRTHDHEHNRSHMVNFEDSIHKLRYRIRTLHPLNGLK